MLSAMVLPAEASPQERYVFKPSFGSSHHWALAQLAGRLAGKRILDIGAGGGNIGRIIRPEGPTELVAVEIDTRAHPLLERTYTEIHTSIEPLTGRQFDYVLLLDVLEHLADPFDFIQKLRPLLAPGARLVISVPNVAHWSVRVPLFFFTRKRLRELCESVPGATLENISASIEPVELALPRWVCDNALFGALARVRKVVAELLPGLMAYQLLTVVRVK
jgi:2-polyprenyl-3-methyl-5-hydroxy-6-metoxy-1,4-benzoquinol methylase